MSIKAQTILAQGDVSIIGITGNSPRGLAFVTWVKLSANTKITFSENGYNVAGGTYAAGTLRWRKPFGYWENNTGADIAAGTVITLQNGSPRASVGSFTGYINSTTSTSFTLSNTNGGHMFISQGGTAPTTGSDNATFNTTNIFALGYKGTSATSASTGSWLTTGDATTNNSGFPTGLSASNSIFLTGQTAGGQFTGNRTGRTLAQFKVDVTDLSKWTLINNTTDVIAFNTTTFPVNAPTASSVNHTGTLQVGQTLTGNYTYADDDATTESGSTFKWYRSDNASGLNKAAIASATAKTYTLGAADVNKHISFEVTPKDATGVIGTAVESALRGPVTAGVLPVQLVDFTVSLELGAVKMNWQTSLEQNNKGFEIYRSGSNNKFVKIADVVSKGSVAVYSFYDKKPLSGINYYQLVQVDIDGKPTTLGTKPLTFNLQASTFDVSPNPTKDKVTLRFESKKYKQLSLSNANGKVLKRIVVQNEQSELQLDLSAYPAGIYFVKLIGSGKSLVKKIVKL